MNDTIMKLEFELFGGIYHKENDYLMLNLCISFIKKQYMYLWPSPLEFFAIIL